MLSGLHPVFTRSRRAVGYVPSVSISVPVISRFGHVADMSMAPPVNSPWPNLYCYPPSMECLRLGVKDNLCGHCSDLGGGNFRLTNAQVRAKSSRCSFCFLHTKHTCGCVTNTPVGVFDRENTCVAVKPFEVGATRAKLERTCKQTALARWSLSGVHSRVQAGLRWGGNTFDDNNLHTGSQQVKNICTLAKYVIPPLTLSASPSPHPRSLHLSQKPLPAGPSQVSVSCTASRGVHTVPPTRGPRAAWLNLAFDRLSQVRKRRDDLNPCQRPLPRQVLGLGA